MIAALTSVDAPADTAGMSLSTPGSELECRGKKAEESASNTRFEVSGALGSAPGIALMIGELFFDQAVGALGFLLCFET